MTLRDRLNARLVRSASGCLEWQGPLDGCGYGRLRVDRKRITRPHRVAWELAHGPIPAGMLVCHTCDNPSCCNVEHLFLGSDQVNRIDAMRKDRIPRKVPLDVRDAAVEAILEGRARVNETANALGIDHSAVVRWVQRHRHRLSEEAAA